MTKKPSQTQSNSMCQQQKLSVRLVQKSSLFSVVKAHKTLRLFSLSWKVSKIMMFQTFPCCLFFVLVCVNCPPDLIFVQFEHWQRGLEDRFSMNAKEQQVAEIFLLGQHDFVIEKIIGQTRFIKSLWAERKRRSITVRGMQ